MLEVIMAAQGNILELDTASIKDDIQLLLA